MSVYRNSPFIGAVRRSGTLILVALLVFLHLGWGSVAISFADVLRALAGGDASEAVRVIVIDHRLPRVLTALMVGGGLALGGLVTQTLFSNPLADPSLFGINAGAAVGAALSTMLPWSLSTLGFGEAISPFGELFTVFPAMVGALFVLWVMVGLSHRYVGKVALLVAGVMLSFLLASVLEVLAYGASADGLRRFRMWTMGDFSSVRLAQLPIFAAALLLPAAYALRSVRTLDALLLGEHYAQTLGVDVRRSRSRLLFAVGWTVAWITALCGPISFVGLAAPHLARRWCGSALHARVLPTAMFVGALLTLFCADVAAVPLHGTLLPINAVTPLIGAPIVLLLLGRRTNH